MLHQVQVRGVGSPASLTIVRHAHDWLVHQWYQGSKRAEHKELGKTGKGNQAFTLVRLHSYRYGVVTNYRKKMPRRYPGATMPQAPHARQPFNLRHTAIGVLVHGRNTHTMQRSVNNWPQASQVHICVLIDPVCMCVPVLGTWLIAVGMQVIRQLLLYCPACKQTNVYTSGNGCTPSEE